MKNNKVLLLYDITSLLIESPDDGLRGGQYFVAYNLLMQFLKSDNLHIVLYSDYRRMYAVNKFVAEELSSFDNFSVYFYNSLWSKLGIFTAKLLDKNKKQSGKDNVLKKIIRFCGYRYLSFYEKYYHKPEFHFYDAFFSATNPLAPFVVKADKLKKYLFLHDAIPVLLKDFYKDENLFYDWFKTLEHCLNTETTYFVNSKCTKDDFLSCYQFLNEKQFNIVYLGAGERFKPCRDEGLIEKVKAKYSIPLDKKYFLLISSFDPRKNFFFAIDNFIEFVKINNLDDINLVISGAIRNTFLQAFNDKISSLSDEMKTKIRSIGYVDDVDVPIIMSGSKCFVMPSVYEGFGMPILEAMKCGCPVICSNTSAMPEVIGDCGIQINPFKNEDMIEAYKKMYFDNDFRDLCISKGMERAKQFTWEACAFKIIGKICSDFFVDKK